MQLLLTTTRESQPDYLTLPLDAPLASWTDPRIVEIPVGIHRHVVRFVEHEGRLHVLKELPGRLADREWGHLSYLRDEGLPVVDVLGVITERGDELDDILITRHLEFSLPFRFLFARSGMPQLQDSLVNAIAVLLVRIHLAGFWWGDCSLSNTLFRRDAGKLSAWLVDTETGELHNELTSGQRSFDLDIAQTNILGGLMDLQAEGQLSDDVDPVALVETLRDQYTCLWAELTAEQVVDMSERHLVDERLQRLNRLGFDTSQITVEAASGGSAIRFKPVVVEAGHHRRLLRELTGVEAQENQARRLVNDLRSYGAWLQGQEQEHLPEIVVAHRWLTDVYEPALAAVPDELRDRREAPELFHEILLHRDDLVASRGAPVRVPEAAASYAALPLRLAETERTVVDTQATA